MGYIKEEDIRGYRVGQEVICVRCIEWGSDFKSSDDLGINDIITDDEVDNDEGFYFCDRCKERL